MKQDLYEIADQLRGVASLGMRYCENGYDRERYEQILKTSARLLAVIENQPMEEIYAQYTSNLAHISPILCVEAVVFREGKILLTQRRDDQTWVVPGGLVEVGESLASGAERELWEEAGLHGKVVRLLGVYDSRLWPTRTRMQLCMAQFLVEADGKPGLHNVEEKVSPLAETLDLGFFAEDQMPENMQLGHDRRAAMAFRMMRGEIPSPFFDRA